MIETFEYLQHFQRPVEIFKEHVNTGLAGLTIRGLLNAYVEIFKKHVNTGISSFHNTGFAECLQSNKTFASIVSTRNPFGLSSNIRGNKSGYLRLISSEGVSWLPKTAVSASNQLLSKYKILMSKVTAEHAGEPDKNGQFRIVSRTEIIGPNDVCTDSYLIIGASEDKSIVENEYKYIQTRFARFLLMLAVSSINLSSDKFQFIPLQNFTERSDIDWNKNLSDIDKQLYIKYNLSTEEIAFIEKMIKVYD